MIWFDLVTPKSVMFFKKIITEVQKRNQEVLVTTRKGNGYSEVVELLRLHKIDFVNRGCFGGADLEDKLKASLMRQKKLMDFIARFDIEKLVCLCSVDANRVAFGLGIPIINFYDIPLSDHKEDFKKAVPQARLTLPLSTKVFHPYVVPKEIFKRFSLEDDQIFTYMFYDVLIWLQDFKADKNYFRGVIDACGLDENRPTIIVREEEYKASYVQRKYPSLYEGLLLLKNKVDANFIIIPRYEAEYLEKEFPFAAVLRKKCVIQHLLAYADLFIGGGGTLNWEACYFGTPAISTRSFISHYDKVLIDEGLMKKADTTDEIVDMSLRILGIRNESRIFFDAMQMNITEMVDEILK